MEEAKKPINLVPKELHQDFYEVILDNFQMTLSLSDERLLIQAENYLNSKNYQKKITHDTVSLISSGLFQTTQSLFQGLIDAIDNNVKTARISMTEDAELICDFEITVGNQKIPLKFKIKLEEEKADEKELLLKQVVKEAKLIEKLSKQVEILTSKVLEQETMVQILKEKSGELPEIEFDPTSPRSSDFLISNYGRTITAIHDGNRLRGILGILVKIPLPKLKKSSFTVRIDYVDHNNRPVMIGICPSSLKDGYNYHEGVGSVTYCGRDNGSIINNGRIQSQQTQKANHGFLGGGGEGGLVLGNYGGSYENNLTKYGGVIGSLIKVTTDLINDEVTFYYNDKRIKTCALDKALTQYYDYYPFVQLGMTYDRVSFVAFKIESE